MSVMQMEALDFRYLLLEYYRKLKINENELATLLMIDHLIGQKNTLVTPDLLSLKMNLSAKELDKIFVNLIEKGYLVFDTGKNIKVSLKPLKKKLYEVFEETLTKEHETKISEEKSRVLQNIYQVFEKELARPLSPLEFSLIGEWVDRGYSDEKIIEAFRVSLSKGKKSLKNVDKILLQWQAKDDIAKSGNTAIKDDWDKDIEKTMQIIKTKWLDD